MARSVGRSRRCPAHTSYVEARDPAISAATTPIMKSQSPSIAVSPRTNSVMSTPASARVRNTERALLQKAPRSSNAAGSSPEAAIFACALFARWTAFARPAWACASAIGKPQPGQVRALSDTERAHSGHVIRDMAQAILSYPGRSALGGDHARLQSSIMIERRHVASPTRSQAAAIKVGA